MKEIIPKHIILKLLKTSAARKFYKQPEEKRHIAYRGTKITMKADFSLETI